ncbi:2'-5' RNA ligase family protein [Lysobacter auxotrophicus]|uniref:2'-5' RNA ligase family protein n=1 Tax=Lysobacter auxotrophicus TaxID=2992573 RepID=A0ABM8DFE0_9GAMM|nr:2'-5' RNA ligase family protein [Lysobacter auxotrophicus]BDU17325.1 2'-5' RNA ligase family protein [Lysobacter auxotrophicus]
MIALDVLLEPDPTTQARARATNAALRADHPVGFAFDDTHLPHVTLAQRYVYERDLPALFAAIESIASAHNPLALSLEVTGVQVRIDGDTGSASWRITSTPALQALADDCLEAAQRLAVAGGTAQAFVPNEDGSPIRESTIRYVERFVPDHSGANYAPHLTLGHARAAFLRELEAAAFEAFQFSPVAVGVYQVGNHGTARRCLWRWPGSG